MKVKSESEVAQSYLTPSDPMDCSLPGSSIHGLCQARVLEWGVIALCKLSKKKEKPTETLSQEHLEPAPTGSETLEIRPLWIQGKTRMKSEILTNHCKGFLIAC